MISHLACFVLSLAIGELIRVNNYSLKSQAGVLESVTLLYSIPVVSKTDSVAANSFEIVYGERFGIFLSKRIFI